MSTQPDCEPCEPGDILVLFTTRAKFSKFLLNVYKSVFVDSETYVPGHTDISDTDIGLTLDGMLCLLAFPRQCTN